MKKSHWFSNYGLSGHLGSLVISQTEISFLKYRKGELVQFPGERRVEKIASLLRVLRNILSGQFILVCG